MGPGLHPQYTRADFGQEAVGGLSSSRAQSTTGRRATDSVLSLGKGESEPNIKNCLGRQVGLVQRFTTIQNFGHT